MLQFHSTWRALAVVLCVGALGSTSAVAQAATETVPPPPVEEIEGVDAPPPPPVDPPTTSADAADNGDTAPDAAGALFSAKDDPPATDPTASADVQENTKLEEAYTTCFESEAKDHDPQACLRDLATSHPKTEVGRRARMVIDAVAVMQRSGARLVPPDNPAVKVPVVDANGDGKEDAPISFDSVVSRVPATVVGVGYGLALGIGGATSLNSAFPLVSTQGAILAGGITSVGAAIGFGTLGFWLSGPDQFRGQGSWLGSGGVLAGASVGIALGAAAVDLVLVTALPRAALDRFAPAVIILPGLAGAALGATAGVAAASVFQLDHDQVAVANGMLGYGAMLGGSLAFGIATIPGTRGGVAVGGLTYAAMVALAAGASFWVVPNLDFNAGEVLVSTLAMVATSGVMLVTAGLSSSGLNLGNATPIFVGTTTAIAGTAGFFGTAAILYFLRDETRPLFRKAKQAGITPLMTPPTIALDRAGKPAFMSPVVGISF